MPAKRASKAGRRCQNKRDLLDAVNVRLLSALCDDPRVIMSALARHLGMSVRRVLPPVYSSTIFESAAQCARRK